MPDRSLNTDSSPIPRTSSPKATSSGISPSSSHAPPGHGLRRSFTVDETRKRPSLSQSPSATSGDDHHHSNRDRSGRRSSNFSNYSLGEARDILNPQASSDGDFSPPESSSLASISLAFALLPALAGALFKNGSALVTDLMLLGLSGVFLHWSVTQPWNWYHAAQEVRIKHESRAEVAIEEDSDVEDSGPIEATSSTQKGSNLDDVPEEEDGDDGGKDVNSRKKAAQPMAAMTPEQRSALRELYLYEAVALLACFSLPLLAAYLLHAIRAQLSRPSEGLVSNYNLTIFCMVSELRVFSHMFKLVQSRTLHLQRIVHKNPYGSGAPVSNGQLEQVLERLERLESQPSVEETTQQQLQQHQNQQQQQKQSDVDTAEKWKQEAAIIREVRNGIQPELDALNRAVRRYEKKATLLQLQTESRFGAVDARLDDAIALAAAAAKNSATHNKNTLARVADSLVSLLLLPFRAVLHILLLPLRTVLALVNRKGNGEQPMTSNKMSRSGRGGSKVNAQTRYNGDRVPIRVTKR